MMTHQLCRFPYSASPLFALDPGLVGGCSPASIQDLYSACILSACSIAQLMMRTQKQFVEFTNN